MFVSSYHWQSLDARCVCHAHATHLQEFDHVSKQTELLSSVNSVLEQQTELLGSIDDSLEILQKYLTPDGLGPAPRRFKTARSELLADLQLTLRYTK
jgi:hypothetical protein